MSGLSDFLTSASSPWWASILTFGAGLVSAHWLQRNSQKREDRVRKEAERRDDRTRFELEVRECAETIDSAVVEIQGNMLHRITIPGSGSNNPDVWRQHHSVIAKMGFKLDMIAPKSISDTATAIANASMQTQFAQTFDEMTDAQTRLQTNREKLVSAVREELRIPD